MSEQQQKDRLWVVGLIAVAAAAEVWATWLGLGSLSGFPVLRLGKIAVATSWTLSVGMEAYGGYAMWVWLAAGGGVRSRAFAMWSSLGAFVLSLIGQVAYHEMLARHAQRAPSWLIGFVACLPVIVLGLAAILTHLMQGDKRAAQAAAEKKRAAEEKAAIERAEADERVALRARVGNLEDELSAARGALETAQAETVEALARAERLEKKLAAMSGQQKTAKARGKQPRNAQAEDLTTELRAVHLLDDDPELKQPRMGGELARRLGVSPATGRRLHSKLTERDRESEALTEEQQ